MAKGKKIAFGLIRVSSSAQELQSQKDALKKIAKEYGYTIADYSEGHDFFSEKISGYDDYDYDRASIVSLRNQILIRKPDAIFIWELSRLTRNATKVSKYINELSLTPKIPMYFADYKLWTIDPATGKMFAPAYMGDNCPARDISCATCRFLDYCFPEYSTLSKKKRENIMAVHSCEKKP
jgi:hypothetical protein